MKLYRTVHGAVLEHEGALFQLDAGWDELLESEDLPGRLLDAAAGAPRLGSLVDAPLVAPLGAQEVGAAGVTYWRSRTARMAESSDAGGGSFYDRVYEAERPELFFKGAGWRARGPGEPVRIRRDAHWSVPEPELVLCVSSRGRIVGYTIGNDMSSRDIEGENPLYLPQAKVYDGSCALGPCLLLGEDALPPDTPIELVIRRGATVHQDRTTVAEMRRSPRELVDWLFRETAFPAGVYLLTGTGIVPPDDFTLRPGDEVRIEIPPIGVLENPVE